MRISNFVSNLTQLSTRKHSDLQLLTSPADDHTQYYDVANSRQVNHLSQGLDASKPASPAVGDVYIASDTGIFYQCYSAGTWTAANSLGSYIGTHALPSATGNLAITGVGFKPSLIKIRAVGVYGTSVGFSEGVAKASANESCQYIAGGSNSTSMTGATDTSHVLDIYVDTGSGSFNLQWSATLVSMDSGGFTLNFDNYTGGASGTFTYECFK